MKTFDEIVIDQDVSGSELSNWIESNWVMPTQEDGTLIFTDDDEARVKLLRELIHEIGANYESMPVILRSMDQVYNLRKLLGRTGLCHSGTPRRCTAGSGRHYS